MRRRHSILKVGSKSNNLYLYKKKEELRNANAEETQKGRSCKDSGKDLNDTFISQGTPKIACSHQKLGLIRHGTDFPSEPPEKASLADILTLNLRPLDL